ncbi:MAG: hypothetical protein ABII79_02130 [bacterium]
MDEKFKALICDLSKKYKELMSMPPLTIDIIPPDCPTGGIYLFSENGIHLYAGRTKRRIKDRLRDHVSTADDCPLAWHLVREETGKTEATYKTEGSRKDLLTQPHFSQAYKQAKNRIKQMEIRYVGEPNPLKQTLLEIYVAVVSGAKFNNFDTH